MNDLLKKRRMQIIRFLFKLISNCKKLIVADADFKNKQYELYFK